MRQSCINYLIYHIVFSTKNCEPLITEEYRRGLYEYIERIVRRQGGVALAVNGAEDHVHLLAKLRQDRAPADIIKELKAGSSGWIHGFFSPDLQDFSWQNGYGVFTVGAAQVDALGKFITTQPVQHRHKSFREEYIELLNEHGVLYEECNILI